MMTAGLVDVHCHLCAGLDDGPQTVEEAAEMCRMAHEEGVRWMAATAHQSASWPGATREAIRAAVGQLSARLRDLAIPLAVRPNAEVMLAPEVEQLWAAGRLMSYSDQGSYLLVEFPPGVCLDIRNLVSRLRGQGVRLVLAHPERHSELLFDFAAVRQLIQLGCLIQVSASSLTASGNERRRALKKWVRSGVVHLVGSDGHSPIRRPPHLADAYRRIASWAGAAAADRICCTNGLAVLQGLPVRTTLPEPPRRKRYLWFF